MFLSKIYRHVSGVAKGCFTFNDRADTFFAARPPARFNTRVYYDVWKNRSSSGRVCFRKSVPAKSNTAYESSRVADTVYDYWSLITPGSVSISTEYRRLPSAENIVPAGVEKLVEKSFAPGETQQSFVNLTFRGVNPNRVR